MVEEPINYENVVSQLQTENDYDGAFHCPDESSKELNLCNLGNGQSTAFRLLLLSSY